MDRKEAIEYWPSSAAHDLCTREFTEEYFTKMKEMHAWLLSQVKP